MTLPDPVRAASETVERVARRSYAKLLAVLSARTRDIAGAEDALAEAFSTALERWPRDGVPANPEAWLLTVARRRGIDAARRATTAEVAGELIRLLTDPVVGLEESGPLADERLAMLFACVHPDIDPSARTPLMLQVVLGLDARAIAAAFLTSPAAMSKRLVRAKQRIREAGIPLVVPEPEQLAVRLGPVLDAIYAAFTDGWGDPGGIDLARRDLADEAIYLADLVTQLVPQSAEAAGLHALMLYAESRRGARRAAGAFIPFERQDRGRWNWRMIERANLELERAGTLRQPGRYQLEAAIQSAHLLRLSAGVDNWQEISALYDGLLMVTGSPVVAINRALALAEWAGASRAFGELESIGSDPRLSSYQPWWVARAQLLGQLGRPEEAGRCWNLAAGLETDPAIRNFLVDRAMLAVGAEKQPRPKT